MSRLTDNDTNFGPLTFGKINWRPWIVRLESGDDESPGNSLIVYAFGWCARLRLPAIIPPYRVRHRATTWDAATIERMGRDFYYETFPRKYGFSLNDGHLTVNFGADTGDSRTTKDWSCFLPWTQWRHVRYSLYDADGNHFWTQLERAGGFDEQFKADQRCPTVSFLFRDFDNQLITAKAKITEHELRFGTGWFKWLGLFRRPRISRSLDLAFSAEVGTEKRSWKGGVMGHGIDMLPGELHEAAFRRYCEKDHRAKHGRYRLQYVGKATADSGQAGQ